MHMYERSQIDILGASQGYYPTNILSGYLENKQQLTANS